MAILHSIWNSIQTVGEAESASWFLFLRYFSPILVTLLLCRCAIPLITFRREPEIWAWLIMGDGTQVPVTHWENVIGRSKSSDIVLDNPAVSRNHAVLTRYDDGSWSIMDTDSKSGTIVGGKKIKISTLKEGNTISVGGVKMKFQPITQRQEHLQTQLRSKAGGYIGAILNLILLTLFQVMITLTFLLTADREVIFSILAGFGGIVAGQWLLLLFYIMIRRSSFELETIGFLLCTMGMAAIVTVCPEEAFKQMAAMVLGILTFLLVGWSLRDLERAKRFRYLAVAAGLGFLAVTLLFGKEYYGAKSWIVIGNVSLQPSELTKVCFVYAGASTMDRIMTKRNLILFIGYSIVICAMLAVMNDFGTALVFFCAFLIIAYLRSGSIGTVALACTALAMAGIMALKIAPHAMQRFTTWRHIWQYPQSSGYQQTNALMCVASGGLLGLGPGKGWLKHIFAADSDIVFATISEEWGLIIALLLTVGIAVIGIFAIRCVRVSRSAFFTIGACTAAGILIIQTILNCLGTLDILPFTGTTFPFVSNGGTSMIGAWGLLGFVKAGDTRQNASFAVRLSKKQRDGNE